MARERLTTRVAEDMKSKANTQVEAKGSGYDNDVYTMNNPEHEKNDPKLDEYAKGDPSAWAEDVHKGDPAKDDGKREETGHAPLIDKQAKEAIASIRKMENKAVRCIIAAERMLPGADAELVEHQASLFMSLPDAHLNATLNNQETFAKSIAAAAEEVVEEVKEEKEEKEAAKEEVVEEKEEEVKEAAKKEVVEEKEEVVEEKEAAKEEVEEEKACDKKAGDCEEKEEEEEEKEEKEASEKDLLQDIFSDVTASTEKKGAATLSGMVKKQASSSVGSDLAGIWNAPPDVSAYF